MKLQSQVNQGYLPPPAYLPPPGGGGRLLPYKSVVGARRKILETPLNRVPESCFMGVFQIHFRP